MKRRPPASLPDRHAALGDAKLGLGDWPGARDAYRAALASAGAASLTARARATVTWKAHLGLGHAYLLGRRPQEAYPHLRQALALGPRNQPEILISLGHACMRLDRLPEAAQYLTRVPRSARAYLDAALLRCDCLRQLGDATRALAALDGLCASQRSPEPLLQRADLLLDVGDPDGALESFNRALALAPGHPRALSGIGQALAELGYREESELAFEAAIAQGDLVRALRPPGLPA